MAAEKVNTRQKMINMMYLVFIAMLALNISKEVLATIGVINEDLETSIQQISNDNIIKYATIDNLQSQPEYQVVYPFVQSLKEKSNSYVNYIKGLKEDLLDSDKEGTDYIREIKNKSNKEKPSQTMTDYQVMDKSGPLDELFFERSELLEAGKTYEDNYINYRTDLISIIDSIKLNDPKYSSDEVALANLVSVVSDLDTRFEYPEDGKKLNSDGKERPFMDYEFKGFPLVASLSKMTKTQNNARYIENKLLSVILGEIAATTTGGGVLQAYLKTPKAQYFSGEVFDGSIIMGQKSTSFDFEEQDLKLIYPGSTTPRDLVEDTDYEIIEGQIVFKKRLNTTGSYKLTGSVTKKDDRNVTTIPINEEFSIIEKPSTATVEAIRMNILYEKLNNPVNIVLPGAVSLQQGSGSKNVKLNPNVDQKAKDEGANFYAIPDTGVGEVLIQVTGLVNGKRESSEPKLFRVKKAPDGKGSIFLSENENYKGGGVSQFNLLNGIITGAKPDDFDYDFNIEVSEFIVTVAPNQSVEIKGNFLLGSLADDYIKRAPSGTAIEFTSIKAIAWEGVNKSEAFEYDIEDFQVYKQ
tara:strand:+ start:5924 stop:7663 length:1740 start_codon:yes stop_codon:yes gene_type:complete